MGRENTFLISLFCLDLNWSNLAMCIWHESERAHYMVHINRLNLAATWESSNGVSRQSQRLKAVSMRLTCSRSYSPIYKYIKISKLWLLSVILTMCTLQGSHAGTVGGGVSLETVGGHISCGDSPGGEFSSSLGRALSGASGECALLWRTDGSESVWQCRFPIRGRNL